MVGNPTICNIKLIVGIIHELMLGLDGNRILDVYSSRKGRNSVYLVDSEQSDSNCFA